ncbi:MAG TPA: transglutaminase family protein [Verrucomicrobiae bacterium]|jgi:transglutaminase-like putative cysteine protease
MSSVVAPQLPASATAQFEIFHRTHYAYAAPVRESFNEVRLQPLSNDRQSVHSFLLKVLPAARLRHYHDLYSNCVHHFELPEPHNTLAIESHLHITTHCAAGLLLESRPAPMSQIKDAIKVDRCYDMLQASRYVDLSPETWRLAVDATEGEDDAWQTALRLMRFVHAHLTYECKSTQVHTTMRDVLQLRRGVCQDYAHVMLGLCRTLRIPALYVSGYLATEIASATHAWVEVFIPGSGWQGLDPTHNCLPTENYVKIGVGRDYADVPPVSGTYRGTTERTMTVDVKVNRRE